MMRVTIEDTKPEILVRKAVPAKGYRFRIDEKKLLGKPDLVRARHHLVIFANGCCWHRYEVCKPSANPKSSSDGRSERKKFADTRVDGASNLGVRDSQLKHFGSQFKWILDER